MANHRGVKLCKAKGQYTKNWTVNVQMSRTLFTNLYKQSRTFRFFSASESVRIAVAATPIVLNCWAVQLESWTSHHRVVWLVVYNRFEHRVTHWKASDHRHIIYLICISNAWVLTKSVKIDQSEGIPDLGIPERPFVKFPTGVLSLPHAALFLFFRALFSAQCPD